MWFKNFFKSLTATSSLILDERIVLRGAQQCNRGILENGSTLGTITDDEPRIVGGGASVVEGNSGSFTTIVRIFLLTAYDQP